MIVCSPVSVPLAGDVTVIVPVIAAPMVRIAVPTMAEPTNGGVVSDISHEADTSRMSRVLRQFDLALDERGCVSVPCQLDLIQVSATR